MTPAVMMKKETQSCAMHGGFRFDHFADVRKMVSTKQGVKKMNERERKHVISVIDVSHVANMLSMMNRELDKFNTNRLPTELRTEFINIRNFLHDHSSSLWEWIVNNTKDIYKED